MADPTAEVIMKVELRVTVTDTEINESKEISLNEYIAIDPLDWHNSWKAAHANITQEMSGMVKALETERLRSQ